MPEMNSPALNNCAGRDFCTTTALIYRMMVCMGVPFEKVRNGEWDERKRCDSQKRRVLQVRQQ